MKNFILIAIFGVGMCLSSCLKPHEAWTGHKEHKPKKGKHTNESYFNKSK